MKKINEIFYSLQGEGFHMGTPSVFVRFSGCNIVCPFCDTKHKDFVLMSDEEIVQVVQKHEASWVILTGGEPGLQVTETFVDLLHQKGKKVAIETNGTQNLPSNIDWITVSPKELKSPILRTADEVKIVYTGNDDFVEHWHDAIRAQHYFLQPCSCQNTDATILYILQHPHWRLSLQMHKYVGIE